MLKSHEDLLNLWRQRIEQLQSKGVPRVLPVGDCIVDRWTKAAAVGAGQGSSVYDSAIIIGDVTIGDNCWIGPWVLLDGSGGLCIGDWSSIAAGCQIYSHDSSRHNLSGGVEPIVRRPTRIGSRVVLKPNVVVALGVTIGDGCLVYANSTVTQDLPNGCKAAGNPAEVISD